MKKQAWNWLNAIVLTIFAGMVAHLGYSLSQGIDIERGDWGWLMVVQVCVIVTILKKMWDESNRGRNAADAPGLAIGQSPNEADTD